MSVPNLELEDALEAELRSALVYHCRLSLEDVEHITAYMKNSGLSFSQSAIELDLVTQTHVNAALDSVQAMNTDEKASLIETAIHKLSDERQLVVHQAEPVKPGPQLLIAHDPYSPRNELLRALRTELLLRNDTRQANVLCVVSPGPREGRSQLAAELAFAFGQLGRRTLLVDGDMRKPRQHALFQADNHRGLSDALLNGDRPYCHPVDGLPHMSLLTTGTIPPNPLELLSSGRFDRMLQDWRRSFEFVVIDTPAMTLCADALALATVAGRVLLVVRSERTRHKDIRESLRRLAATRAQMLGTVMNRF